MINNPKVSIVIPVYNTEKYIEQCVNSIINQSYKNIEILLINDGSTDKSDIIIENYRIVDTRIKIINQNNQGAAKARNVGIQNSTGQYIIFIDSDDYWDDTNCIEKMIKNMIESGADILNFGYKKYFEKEKLIKCYRYNYNRMLIDFDSKKNTLFYFAKHNLLLSSPCNKIIKKNLIIDNNLYFREGITSEDIDWNARLIIFAEKFDVIDENIYVYRQRSDSVSHSLSNKDIECLLHNIEKCISYINIYRLHESSFINEYMSYIAYQYMALLVVIQSSKIKLNNEYTLKIREYRYLLNYDINYRVRIFGVINKFLGFYLLNLIIRIYIKIKGAI
ncbi:glycosyltransferase [Terrisporobacter glycolicus]|nr:glycosyltransferase [Terrisporobacter glycolicus]